MENRSTGALIARERRFLGFSQRTLAYRIGVDRKTVQSWERGDTSPSLSMLNTLSHVLELSPEEIIRGERNEDGVSDPLSPVAAKQARRMLVSSLAKFRKANFICIAIVMAGVFVGMFSNLVLMRAWGAFIVNFISIIIACVAEAKALSEAYHSVAADSLDVKKIALFRGSLLKRGMGAYMVAMLFFGWSLPLLVYVDSFDRGLPATQTFMYGAVWGSAFLCLSAVICFELHAWFIRKGKIPLTERDRKIYFHNHKLLTIVCVAFVLTMSLSVWGEIFLTRADRLMKEQEFWDISSFVSYMQNDLRYPYDGSRERDMIVFYTDRRGNPISESEALRTSLRDSTGNVICSYLDRNRNVYDIKLTENAGGIFPIKVKTFTAMHDAKNMEILCHTIFAFLYAIEMFVFFIIYFRKRQEH